MLCRVHKPFMSTALPLLEMLGDVRSIDFTSSERDVAVVDVAVIGEDGATGHGMLEISINREARSATIRLVPC